MGRLGAPSVYGNICDKTKIDVFPGLQITTKPREFIVHRSAVCYVPRRHTLDCIISPCLGF